MPKSPEGDEEERAGQPSVPRRMAWFFAIAAIMGVAFAAAAGLLRWLLLR
jgi:hypothetical protein